MKKHVHTDYFPTTAVSDGQDGSGYVGGGIHAIRNDFTLVGRALTVNLPVGENGAILEAILQAKRGDVLVVNAKGDRNRAVAGDFVIAMMKKVGISGLVVDGVIRDLQAVRALDFPVFCKGTTAVAGVKNGGGMINIPIALGNVAVNPGDYIFADVDGVVVVRQENLGEVIERTKKKLISDEKRENEVLHSKATVLNYLQQVVKK